MKAYFNLFLFVSLFISTQINGMRGHRNYEAQDLLGNTLLHDALIENQPAKYILAILALGPRATQLQNIHGFAPLLLAIMQGYNTRTIFTLLTHNPGAVETPNNAGNTPLYEALVHNHPDQVLFLLLSYGANPNQGLRVDLAPHLIERYTQFLLNNPWLKNRHGVFVADLIENPGLRARIEQERYLKLVEKTTIDPERHFLAIPEEWNEQLRRLLRAGL